MALERYSPAGPGQRATAARSASSRCAEHEAAGLLDAFLARQVGDADPERAAQPELVE
jgi:hypothetical protein